MLREHVVMIHETAVRHGSLGFDPLDRVRVLHPSQTRECPFRASPRIATPDGR